MNFLVLLARLCFSLVFINSGIGHFKNTQHLAGFAESKSVPFPVFSTYISGVMLLLGGLSILLGLWVPVGALLIIISMIPVTFMMHNFWTIDDPEARQNDQIHFSKNISMIGGAFLLWYLYTHVAVPWSLGNVI